MKTRPKKTHLDHHALTMSLFHRVDVSDIWWHPASLSLVGGNTAIKVANRPSKRRLTRTQVTCTETDIFYWLYNYELVTSKLRFDWRNVTWQLSSSQTTPTNCCFFLHHQWMEVIIKGHVTSFHRDVKGVCVCLSQTQTERRSWVCTAAAVFYSAVGAH